MPHKGSDSLDDLQVAPTRADDGVPAVAASVWRGTRVLSRADVQLLTHLAGSEGLTTAALQGSTARPLESLLSSLRDLRKLGYIGWDGSRWSIREAGRRALELARGEASHLVIDLREIAGVGVTAHDARRSFHRIDVRLCPLPFRHVVFKWIQSLYGTTGQPVRSSTIKNTASWVLHLLQFYADQYPSDDDLRHLSTDVVRQWVRAVRPQRQPTRDAYLDHVARRLKALVQFCDWLQMNEPGCLPSALEPASLRRAGLAEVDAACEARPVRVQTPALEPPNGPYVGRRYGNKGGV